MVEIYSKSLVTAIGKVSLMTFSWNTNQKGDEKWPSFIYRQLFWWSASIILENNNDVLKLERGG